MKFQLPRNIYQRNFDRLVKVGIINAKGELQFKEALKLKSHGYMDLNFDEIETDGQGQVIAMAHNYIQEGDVMADPDMTIRIIPEMLSIEALTFQMSNPPIYQDVYPEKNTVNMRLKKEPNSFLEQWLTNIISQRFKHEPEKAVCEAAV